MMRLQVEGLEVRYGGAAVLHGVDLSLPPGQFAALLGPNGAGKSTLLHAIAGVVRAARGAVRIDGIDIARDPRAARMRLGLAVPPSLLPERLTGRECLRLFAAARGLREPPRDAFDLLEALRATAMLDRSVSHYSLGTRQKLGILLGLLGAPPLLLLDEPVNGLDPLSAHVLKQHLRERARGHGDTVLMATHALDVAERTVDRALLLVDGRIAHAWDAGELEAIRRDPAQSLEMRMVAALAEHPPE